MRGAFVAKTLCQSTLIVVIAIGINVAASIIAIAVLPTSAVARGKVTLCRIHAAVILVHANLLAKLGRCLELCTFFDALELHALKQAIKLVLCKLSLKKLGDAFEHRHCKLFAKNNKEEINNVYNLPWTKQSIRCYLHALAGFPVESE